MVIGLILVAVGVIALLIKMGVITGTIWGYTWPVVLIIFGLWFLSRRSWKRAWWCCDWYPREKEEGHSRKDD